MVTNYYEQICPFCKTQFKEGDDIVICSVCEMPHHKDCWIENKGCTTFGCTGTIKGADIADYSNTMNNACSQTREFYFCTSCGAKNPSSANFCGSCGNKLFKPDIIENVQQNLPVNVIQQNSTFYTDEPNINSNNQYDPGIYPDYELVNQFVKVNDFTYIQKFRRLHMKNTSVSWNWCAFIFGFYWFAYRKMYAYATALFISCCILAFWGSFGSSLTVILAIVLGLYADKIYFNFINKKLANVKDYSHDVKDNFCNNNGGVSMYACVLMLLILIVIYVILAFIRL